MIYLLSKYTTLTWIKKHLINIYIFLYVKVSLDFAREIFLKIIFLDQPRTWMRGHGEIHYTSRIARCLNDLRNSRYSGMVSATSRQNFGEWLNSRKWQSSWTIT